MSRIMLTCVPTKLNIYNMFIYVYALLLLPNLFDAQADSVQSSLSFGVKNALAATSLGQWKSKKSITSKVKQTLIFIHMLQ